MRSPRCRAARPPSKLWEFQPPCSESPRQHPPLLYPATDGSRAVTSSAYCQASPLHMLPPPAKHVQSRNAPEIAPDAERHFSLPAARAVPENARAATENKPLPPLPAACAGPESSTSHRPIPPPVIS